MVTDTRTSRNGNTAVVDESASDVEVAESSASSKKKSSRGTTSSREKGIAKIRVFCVGETPLMMDPMTEETLNGLATGVHAAIKRDAPHEEVAGAKVMKNADGEIIIPIENLFACVVEAGRKVKFDAKTKISTLGSTTLPEFFRFVTDELVLVKADGKTPLTDDDWTVDKRRGCLKDGTAVAIRRPKFAEWAFFVEFEYDENRIAQDKLVELFRVAGAAMGLCSFRPNKKGRFGTFKLRRWELMSRRAVVDDLEMIDHTQKAA